MLEISPVLAGTYNKPDYVPASVNFNQGTQPADTTAATDDVDPRRYSQYDRSASKVADATMSFGDFLDMVNPLQHIPVVSSIYRYATGDTINPVARVAGDILYGAAGGIVGAVAGAVGAIGDSVAESQTGKDMTGVVVAALFGDDDKDTQTKNSAPIQMASATQPELVTAEIPDVATPIADPAAIPIHAQPLTGAKSIPIASNKSPLAGMALPDYHTENMKMSVASATGLHIGNTVYPSFGRNSMRSLPGPAAPATKTVPAAPTPRMAALKLQPAAPTPATPAQTASATPAASPAPTPTMASTEPPSPAAVAAALTAAETATPATAATTASVTAAASGPATIAAEQQAAAPADTTLPPGLKDDALILKALGMYRSVADGNVSVARGQNN